MSEERRTLTDEEIVTTPADARFRQQEDSDGDDSDTTDADTDDTDSDADDTDSS